MPFLLPFYFFLFTLKVRKIHFHIGISSFLLLISFFACEKSTAPESKPQVTLTVEYVGVTETELLLQTKNIEANTQYQLFRDDSLISDGTLIYTDTTIIDTILLPAHNYIYKARLIKDGKSVANSQPLDITTMDTTSHDFQWETFSFGGLGSSLLYDVAIINETDIWSVGEIYADSTQPWLPYNAIHWNGQQWELMRIKTNACGGVDYPAIRAVFAFSSFEVLFAHIDGSITCFDGNNFINDCSLITQLNGSVRQMWGVNANDLFVVSGNGFIAHYNGTNWQKLESGTETHINDIWGTTDFPTPKQHILAVVSDEYHLGDMRILSVHPNSVRDTLNWNFDRRVMSVWFMDHTGIYVCGSGVWVYQHGNWRLLDLTNYFTLRVRGSAANNIFIVGAYGSVLHFNGLSWHTYPELILSNGKLLGLAVTDNLVIAVGYTDYRGFILTGKRF